jgi:glucosamine--fructose-6-phosphate aminotransferase (isomerizing)
MMCGIVGYLGYKAIAPLLVESLRTLEYRGYDSSGIALYNPATQNIQIYKATGKLQNLVDALPPALWQEPPSKTLQVGIGHIRWATHGAPTVENAHPHHGQHGEVVLVHNGIIENFAELKQALQAKGYVFNSQTDTETVAHLLEELLSTHENNFLPAVAALRRELHGAYALTMMHKQAPGKLYVARQQAPLVIGVGQQGEYWVASDVVALVSYTNQIIYLEDGQYAELSEEGGVKLFGADNTPVEVKIHTIQTGPLTIDKKGYKHFMLKEIYEQPDVVRNALLERITSEASPVFMANDTPIPSKEAVSIAQLTHEVDRVIIIGCGTSYNAGMVAKYLIEALVRIPVEVEAAGEYRYRSPVLHERCLVVAISQSGETADTLEALRLAIRHGAKTIALTNRPDSTMAREVDAVINVRAGVEVSVCATKSFVAQIVALYLLGMMMCEHRGGGEQQAMLPELKKALLTLPVLMESFLSNVDVLQKLARKYGHYSSMLFIARGIGFPAALEGALKLKEISYIHAEGYSGAELKHGPIALLDESMPVVCLLSDGSVFDKMLSNCQEAKARSAQMIAVTNKPIPHGYETTFDDIITYPACHEWVSPLLGSLPLQLLAYYTAEFLGKDVDQPRNLAKSVTVE